MTKGRAPIALLSLLCTACPATPPQGGVAAKQEKIATGANESPDAKTPVKPSEQDARPVEPPEIGDAPLAHAHGSLDELARAVIDALDTRDETELQLLAVSASEYKERLFGALVEHPSAYKMGPDLLWDIHFAESKGELDNVLTRWGGKNLALERVVVGRTDPRGAVVFHEQVVIVAKDGDGATHELRILGPVVEHVPSGGFKVLAYKEGD